MDTEVICSFIRRCKNFPDECSNCKWNSRCKIGDYLLMETKDGKTIHYLESCE